MTGQTGARVALTLHGGHVPSRFGAIRAEWPRGQRSPTGTGGIRRPLERGWKATEAGVVSSASIPESILPVRAAQSMACWTTLAQLPAYWHLIQ